VRIFQNQKFEQFAIRNRISLNAICDVVRELSSGLIHANLGGGVYKQRIARAGQGKSGGFRGIVFFRVESRIFFVVGFAKNDKSSLSPHELASLKVFAKEFFSYDEQQIECLLANRSLLEIFCKDAV
jgi:hypothetical protein